jgi:hypothetical protein
MADRRKACRGVNTRQAVHIAWDRALAFSWLGQRFSVLARFFALWLWPFHLATVGGQGSRIRHVQGASLADNDGSDRRFHWPALVVAAITFAAEVGLIAMAGVALSLALLRLVPPVLAGALGLLVVVSPLVLEVIGGVINVAGDIESRSLNRRRDELSKNGPASTMSSLVRARNAPAGAGRRLLAAMKSEWRERQSVVVFYPATAALVSYYAQEGAVLDDGAHRRMKFDFQSAEDHEQG